MSIYNNNFNTVNNNHNKKISHKKISHLKLLYLK